jgi:hypothetical protein
MISLLSILGVFHFGNTRFWKSSSRMNQGGGPLFEAMDPK